MLQSHASHCTGHANSKANRYSASRIIGFLNKSSAGEPLQVPIDDFVEASEYLIQVRRQLAKDSVVLIRRTRIPHFDEVLEHRKLIVELDRVIQCVAGTAIAHLVHIL